MKKIEKVVKTQVFTSKEFYKEYLESINSEKTIHAELFVAKASPYDWIKDGMKIEKFVKHFRVGDLNSEFIKIVEKTETFYEITKDDVLELTKTKNLREASEKIQINAASISKWIKFGISEKVFIKHFGVIENDKKRCTNCDCEVEDKNYSKCSHCRYVHSIPC